MMNPLMKMWDDELKEFAKMIAERQGYRPTEKMEEVRHEKVSEGENQEGKGKGEEEQKEGRSEGKPETGEGATLA